jgi:hypothetical protein
LPPSFSTRPGGRGGCGALAISLQRVGANAVRGDLELHPEAHGLLRGYKWQL